MTIRKLAFTNRKQFLGCTECFPKVIPKSAKQFSINCVNKLQNIKSHGELKRRKEMERKKFRW